jgi:hypothetical protein
MNRINLGLLIDEPKARQFAVALILIWLISIFWINWSERLDMAFGVGGSRILEVGGFPARRAIAEGGVRPPGVYTQSAIVR